MASSDPPDASQRTRVSKPSEGKDLTSPPAWSAHILFSENVAHGHYSNRTEEARARRASQHAILYSKTHPHAKPGAGSSRLSEDLPNNAKTVISSPRIKRDQESWGWGLSAKKGARQSLSKHLFNPQLEPGSRTEAKPLASCGFHILVHAKPLPGPPRVWADPIIPLGPAFPRRAPSSMLLSLSQLLVLTLPAASPLRRLLRYNKYYCRSG